MSKGAVIVNEKTTLSHGRESTDWKRSVVSIVALQKAKGRCEIKLHRSISQFINMLENIFDIVNILLMIFSPSSDSK